MRKVLLFSLSFFLLQGISGQTISINTTGTIGDASSMLDVSSSNKGLLIPRMSTAQINAIASPAKGLLVYDSILNQFKVNIGSANAPNWQSLANLGSGWGLAGNAGTDANNFIGTTDGAPLNIRVNNKLSGNIDSASYNTSWGYRAAESTTGAYNTANGFKSLFSNSTGIQNTSYGSFSLYYNTTGRTNTGIGANSLYSNTTGTANTASGMNSLFYNTTGNYNTATGSGALFENTVGHSNTANGISSLFYNTSGSNNTAIGNGALASNSTASLSTAIGDSALYWNNGVYNTALGGHTLSSNTTGYYNTAAGGEALLYNVDGDNNTAIGENAMRSNTSGSVNASTGNASLGENTTGSFNAAFGPGALFSNTTGSNNTGVGSSANVGTGNLTNATAVGANALVTQSNSLVLGSINNINTATASVNVGIGTTAPAHILDIQGNSALGGTVQLRLHETQADYTRMKFTNTASTNYWDLAVLPNVNGANAAAEFNLYYSPFGGNVFSVKGNGNLVIQGTLTQSSDERLKKNIVPLSASLDKVLQLNGYQYEWKDSNRDPDPQIGVLAQEVQKILPELVKEDDKGMLSVSYNGLIPVLIDAIKEQQQQIESLKKEVKTLHKKRRSH